MQEIAKALVIFGIVLVGIGLFLAFFHKIPYLGRLPGDILIQKKNLTFYTFAATKPHPSGCGWNVAVQYSAPGNRGLQSAELHFPLATSILVSITLSLLFWLWPRR